MGTLIGRFIRAIGDNLFIDDLNGNCFCFKTRQASELAFHLRFFLSDDGWKPELMCDTQGVYVSYGDGAQDILAFNFDGVRQFGWAFARLLAALDEQKVSGVWLDELTEEYDLFWGHEPTRNFKRKASGEVRVS